MREDISKYSVKDLLLQYVVIIEELKKRGILRSNNNPIGDYTEWLVSKAFDLKIQSNSNKGYDAIDSTGNKYQIKGRKITPENPSRQLNVIRNLEDKHFDFLIGVLFDKDFSVIEAYKVPHSIIGKYSTYSEPQNGEILQLKGELLSAKGVERIDEQIRETECGLPTKLAPSLKIIENHTSSGSQEQGKNYSKYSFQGRKYHKNHLVLAIVDKYLKDNPDTSYENLVRIFPDALQGSRGVLRREEEIEDKKRYFIDNPLLAGDGVVFFVCNQWGTIKEKFNTTRQDIDNLVEYVNGKLKYEIKKV